MAPRSLITPIHDDYLSADNSLSSRVTTGIIHFQKLNQFQNFQQFLPPDALVPVQGSRYTDVSRPNFVPAPNFTYLLT